VLCMSSIVCKPQRYLGYVALMSQINDAEPTIYEDVAKQQVWKMPWWKNINPS
jgi:hypothetical protein